MDSKGASPFSLLQPSPHHTMKMQKKKRGGDTSGSWWSSPPPPCRLIALILVASVLAMMLPSPLYRPPAAAQVGGEDGVTFRGTGGGFRLIEPAEGELRLLRRGNSRPPSSSAAAFGVAPPEYALVRVIGNDLPPRHKIGQSLENVRFILDNEPDFPGCRKLWVVNRIFHKYVEEEVVALLRGRNQTFMRIPFLREEYGRIPLHLDAFPSYEFTFRRQVHRGIMEEIYHEKILYAMNNNGARNAALKYGRTTGARWILPFDGNCFFSEQAWAELVDVIALPDPGVQYVIVPMARLENNDLIRTPFFRPVAREEPQVVFRTDATEEFDPTLRYGRRPKIEFLWRLGVPGSWDTWKKYNWEKDWPKILPSTPPGFGDGAANQAAAAPFRIGGWVARLFSGNAHSETSRADRGDSRSRAIKLFVDNIDITLQGTSIDPQIPVLYNHKVPAGSTSAPALRQLALVASRIAQVLGAAIPFPVSSEILLSPTFSPERVMLEGISANISRAVQIPQEGADSELGDAYDDADAGGSAEPAEGDMETGERESADDVSREGDHEAPAPPEGNEGESEEVAPSPKPPGKKKKGRKNKSSAPQKRSLLGLEEGEEAEEAEQGEQGEQQQEEGAAPPALTTAVATPLPTESPVVQLAYFVPATFRDITVLALSSTLLGNNTHGELAATLVRQWFLGPDTPQPRNFSGSDWKVFCHPVNRNLLPVLDSLRLLRRSGHLGEEEYAAVVSWAEAYLDRLWSPSSGYFLPPVRNSGKQGLFSLVAAAGLAVFTNRIEPLISTYPMLGQLAITKIDEEGHIVGDELVDWHAEFFIGLSLAGRLLLLSDMRDLWDLKSKTGRGRLQAARDVLLGELDKEHWLPHALGVFGRQQNQAADLPVWSRDITHLPPEGSGVPPFWSLMKDGEPPRLSL